MKSLPTRNVILNQVGATWLKLIKVESKSCCWRAEKTNIRKNKGSGKVEIMTDSPFRKRWTVHVGGQVLNLYYVKWRDPIEKNVVHFKYLVYLHQTSTVVFAILSAVKKKFHPSCTIITKVTLFGYVKLFFQCSADQWKNKLCAQVS